MKPASICILLLSVPFLLSTTISAAGPMLESGLPLFQRACSMAKDKDFCVRTLQSDPTSAKADMTGLAFIALKIAANKAANITENLNNMVNRDQTLEPMVEQGLTECADHYGDAVDQIEGALAALSVKAFKDIPSWTKNALVDAESCEEGIVSLAGKVNFLVADNKLFRQYLDSASVVAKQAAVKKKQTQ